MDTVPAQFRDRNLYRHNPNVTLMRTTPEECARDRPVHRRQAEPHGRPGALPDPGGRRLAHRRARQAVLGPGGGPGAVRRDRLRVPRDARTASSSGCRTTSTTRPSATRWWPPSTRSSAAPARGARRSVSWHAPHLPPGILKRLRGMIRRGEPIIGGRRRHRALRQVRGGGRHRPDRDLQLRPLPHGRPRLAGRAHGLRQRQRDRARHGARGAAGGEADAGARRRQRHRPVHDHRRLPAAARRARLLGGAELPDGRASSTAPSAPSSRRRAWATGSRSR